MSSQEILKSINQSEDLLSFNKWYFLQFLMTHCTYFLVPVGINIPIILMITKCKWKSAYNQDFLSFCRLPLQTILAFFINAVIFYWIYATIYLSEDLEEQGYKLLDWKDMFQFP